MAIPGPLGPAAIGAIIVGVIMVLMGILGYKAARDRKIEGKELKGKCELFIYAAVVFSMFATLLVVSIVLLVWLGGTLPKTGQDVVDSLAEDSVDAAQKPVANLVGCVYDSCCFADITDSIAANTSASATPSPSNDTESLWADCLLDENGIPDENGENIKTGENGTITREDIIKFANANKYCDMFADVDCTQGVKKYRQDAGKMIHKNLSPFAYSIAALAGLLCLGWIFAVAEIFWCCGQSDLDENKTKVAPDYYDDY
eukprot:g2713.t1